MIQINEIDINRLNRKKRVVKIPIYGGVGGGHKYGQSQAEFLESVAIPAVRTLEAVISQRTCAQG